MKATRPQLAEANRYGKASLGESLGESPTPHRMGAVPCVGRPISSLPRGGRGCHRIPAHRRPHRLPESPAMPSHNYKGAP